MKTALLAQNDNTVIENLKQNVGRSGFDLSYSVAFPIDVDGAILPIFLLETVPSDTIEISVECMIRQLSPLTVPLFTNLRLNTAFYYCDNRLAWKKWDRFMTGGRSGNEVYNIPKMYNFSVVSSSPVQMDKYTVLDYDTYSSSPTHINYKNTLHTYFNYSLNEKFDSNAQTYSDFVSKIDDLPVAFPFFDYQLICRDYYTDVDRLPDSPTNNITVNTDYDDIDSDWTYQNLFPEDDDEIRLKDGPQFKSGFRSGDDTSLSNNFGFLLDKVRYHNVRPDYFTSSKKAPMRGDEPGVTLGTISSRLDATNLTLEQNLTGNQDTVIEPNYADQNDNRFRVILDDEGDAKIGIGQSTQTGTYFNFKPKAGAGEILRMAIESGIEVVNGAIAQITAAELRLLSQLTIWKELNMLHEPYYNDFLNAHFNGIRVGESPVEKPIYIGGTSQLIQINQIIQQSASTESSPLGTQGAIAQSLENNYVGKYFCNNYGYIIGVAYIQADLMYKPAVPRHFSRRTKEDYYSPEFANLSMQAILNKEQFFSNDKDWNNSPWGYTGAFDEMRTKMNHVAGDLLNSSYSDLTAWALTREAANDNLPSMSSKWLSLKGNIDKTYRWTVPSMPAFILQAANYVKALRPMPYVAIPKAL